MTIWMVASCECGPLHEFTPFIRGFIALPCSSLPLDANSDRPRNMSFLHSTRQQPLGWPQGLQICQFLSEFHYICLIQPNTHFKLTFWGLNQQKNMLLNHRRKSTFCIFWPEKLSSISVILLLDYFAHYTPGFHTIGEG